MSFNRFENERMMAIVQAGERRDEEEARQPTVSGASRLARAERGRGAAGAAVGETGDLDELPRVALAQQLRRRSAVCSAWPPRCTTRCP